MRDLAEHLWIVHGIFLVAEAQMDLTMYYKRCLHRDVWAQTDRYVLAPGKRWHKKYAYYYSWSYPSRFLAGDPEAQRLRSGHDWRGPFESRQEAFAHAYSCHSPLSRLPQGEVSDAWEQYAARMGLTIPVSET
jgi:hypothetical protein